MAATKTETGTVAAATVGGTGTTWGTSSNVLGAADTNTTDCDNSGGGAAVKSKNLNCYGFFSAIPDWVSPTALSVLIKKKRTYAAVSDVTDYRVQGIVGTTTKGSDDADTSAQWPASLSDITHDGTDAGDALWDLAGSVTGAEYRNGTSAGFGIRILADIEAGEQAHIDCMTATLTYRHKPMYWGPTGGRVGVKSHWW